MAATPTVTRAGEDYLKEMFRLQLAQGEKQDPIAPGDLAQVLGVAAPSVTSMLQKLTKEGLVHHKPYQGATLTETGRFVATQVLRRHRLIETFLNQALGLGWGEVHEEAERLEHAVSDKLLERIDEFLGHPATDPHGDPIPASDGTMRIRATKEIAECAHGDRVRIVTVRGHDKEFFDFLSNNGLALETVVTIAPSHPAAGVILLQPEGDGPPVALAAHHGERVAVEVIQ